MGEMPALGGMLHTEALFPAFELMRVALAGAGHQEGRVVAVFVSRTSAPNWCQSSAFSQQLRRTSTRFEELWATRNVADIPGSLDGLQRELANWLSSEAIGEQAAALADMMLLARWLARARHPGLGARTLRRTNLSLWHAALEQVASAPGAFFHDGKRNVPDAGPRANHRMLIPATPAAAQDSVTEEPTGAPTTKTKPTWKQGPLPVRLARKVPETSDVTTFAFEPLEPTELVYRPGQSATLLLRIDGEEVRRSYTIASSPSRQERLLITVKRVPGGKVSNWLVDHAEIGCELALLGPHGKFSWANEKPKKVLFVSAGSGITPMLSMARYCLDAFPQTDIVFWHAARHQNDLICATELAAYQAQHADFRLVYCLSREPDDSGWTGLRGRCSTETLFASVPDLLDRTIYLCGPLPFREQVRQSLDELGFDATRFHSESFGGASAKRITTRITSRKWQRQDLTELLPAPSRMRSWMTEGLPSLAPDSTFDLVDPLAQDAVVDAEASTTAEIRVHGLPVPIPVHPERTVLEALESAGVAIESSCRMGVCGTCKARCVRGAVDFDNAGGLTEEEEKSGWILSCTAYAAASLELEV